MVLDDGPLVLVETRRDLRAIMQLLRPAADRLKRTRTSTPPAPGADGLTAGPVGASRPVAILETRHTMLILLSPPNRWTTTPPPRRSAAHAAAVHSTVQAAHFRSCASRRRRSLALMKISDPWLQTGTWRATRPGCRFSARNARQALLAFNGDVRRAGRRTPGA